MYAKTYSLFSNSLILTVTLILEVIIGCVWDDGVYENPPSEPSDDQSTIIVMIPTKGPIYRKWITIVTVV